MNRGYLLVLPLALLGASCSQPTNVLAPSALQSGVTTSVAATATGNEAAIAPASGTFSSNSAFSAVKQATARFHDPSQAAAAGYAQPDAAHCVSSPAGAMGVHSVNASLASNTTVNETEPEVLIYMPKPGGGFQLVAVEYLAPVLLRNLATGAVAPWFSPSPWPASEYAVVNPAPTMFGRTFDGPMRGHEPGMPWHYDLHVWVWSPNPNGDFAHFNPRLSCSPTE